MRHALPLRKAESYIRENYTRKVSLKEVAEVSGLSAPYFSTVFKEEMGENLSSYLNRLRVDRAAELLLDTDLSLSEIAGSCGFEDQSWFSKIFKSYTGLSPGRYRDNNRGVSAALLGDDLPVDYRSMDGTKNE
jgi:AraC-like DNA-binding protein